jgi:hypothetical protein
MPMPRRVVMNFPWAFYCENTGALVVQFGGVALMI